MLRVAGAQVAEFVDEAVKITVDIKKELGKHKMKDFKEAVRNNVRCPHHFPTVLSLC